MIPLVRPELPTAALRSSQATHAAVDNSAPNPPRPDSTYKSGKVVQTNGTTSVHGLDFVDAAHVFEGVTFTFEDDRFAYGEQRFVTLGLLAGIPVSVVHTENEHEIRIISFRKATKRESQIYFDEIQD